MKLYQLAIALLAILAVVATAQPASLPSSPRSRLDDFVRQHPHLSVVDVATMDGMKSEDIRPSLSDTAPRRPRRHGKDSSVNSAGGEPGRVEQLKLRIFNTNTRKYEEYDPLKHLSFPTDLRNDKLSAKDIREVIKQAKQHETMTKEQEDVMRDNMVRMHSGAIHLAREGGKIQDEKGYMYTHDPSSDLPSSDTSFSRYIGGGDILHKVTDRNGKIAFVRQ